MPFKPVFNKLQQTENIFFANFDLGNPQTNRGNHDFMLGCMFGKIISNRFGEALFGRKVLFKEAE